MGAILFGAFSDIVPEYFGRMILKAFAIAAA